MTTTKSRIQGVIHIDLEEFRTGSTYDSTQLDRVMRDWGDCLAIGAPVRIRVHDLAPVGTTFWRTLPLTF